MLVTLSYKRHWTLVNSSVGYQEYMAGASLPKILPSPVALEKSLFEEMVHESVALGCGSYMN